MAAKYNLSAEELERRRREHLCFRCGSGTHLRKTCGQAPAVAAVQVPMIKLRTVTKEEMKVREGVALRVTLAGRQLWVQAMILDGPVVPLLLGMDVLAAANPVIDLATRTVQFESMKPVRVRGKGSLGSGVIGVVQQDEAAPAVVAKAADVQNEAKPAVAQVARDEAKPAVAQETEAQDETKPATQAKPAQGEAQPTVATEAEPATATEAKPAAAAEEAKPVVTGTKPAPVAILREASEARLPSSVVAFRRRRKRQKRRMFVRLVAAADALEVVLPEAYAEFADRFEPSGPKKLPVSRPGFDAVIRIDPSKQLRCDPNRKFGRSKEEALRKYVEDGLKTGMIVESESAFCSQPMFVKKGDGWRATIRDRYPSPDALALIDKLKGAKFFSKFDLTSAFWQVRLSADSEKYTAFPCDGKLYQHRVMCFGLVNAPAMFQRLINEVMGPLSAFAGGYFDDIIVFSKTPEEHELHVKQMLARLREFDLYVSLKKCVFGTSSVDFLGRRVSEAGVAVDPRKVQAVLNWKPPTDATGVREVNGLASFMRRHVPNYAELARPMTMLTRKNIPFVWSAECEKSFRAIQQALVQAP
ncbi:hypothetical protein CAOG_08857, partial [Capsaspora owczarzaki ATCC 30864]|uniref:hypothetical protein n=1 Tax=Capsaspora owczarzaki (strain ATCC 30864) TaxID=595528 RepID=UPI00035213CF